MEKAPFGNSPHDTFTKVGAKRGWRSERAVAKRQCHRSLSVNKSSRLLRRQSNELPGSQVATLAWGSKRVGARTPATSTTSTGAAPDYQPHNSKLLSSKGVRQFWNQNKMRVAQRWKHFLSQKMRFLLRIKGAKHLYKDSRRQSAKNARKALVKRQLTEATRKLRMGICSLNARG